MGNTLDNPNTQKVTHNFTSHEGLIVGASGMQGWRTEMEDAHIVINIPSKPDHLFLAVFDGHAGAGSAHFAEENFISILESTNQWKEYLSGGATNIKLLGEALEIAFVDVDDKLREHQNTDARDNSGCTSVTAIITPQYIICANAGDSRCVLGTQGGTKPLSDDHKPNGAIEKQRIEAAGGIIQWNRVDGDLAVSRALGDFGYKTDSNLAPKDQKITCWPDISIHERHPSDDVLVLACDGLWDVFTSEEAVNKVRYLYSVGETVMGQIAEELLDSALEKGSKDNISAVVVKLPGARLGPEDNGGVAGLRKERQKVKAQQTIASLNDQS